MYNCNRHTGLSGTSCAARAVGVYSRIVGQTVVDYVGEVVDIEASRGNVGSYQESDYAVAEFPHHDIALLLAQVAVQSVGVVTVADKLVGDFLGVATCAAEYDSVDAGVIVGDTLQCQVFILGIDHVVYMTHILCALVAGAYHNFFRLVHEPFCDFSHLCRHCCREKEHFAVVGYMGQDVVDRINEAHVEHLVGLVEYHCMHVGEFYNAAVDQVDKSTGGSYDNLHALLECANLAFDTAAAVYRQHGHIVHIFGEIRQVACYLEAQFTSGGKYQGLRYVP